MNSKRYSVAIIAAITGIGIQNKQHAIGALNCAALMLLVPNQGRDDMFDAFSLKVEDLTKEAKDVDTLAGLTESLGITLGSLVGTMDRAPAAFFKDRLSVLCDRYAMLTSTTDLSRIERAVFTRFALTERLKVLDAESVRPGAHRVGNSGGGSDGPNGSARADNERPIIAAA